MVFTGGPTLYQAIGVNVDLEKVGGDYKMTDHAIQQVWMFNGSGDLT